MTNFEKIISLAVSFLIIVALIFGMIIFRQQKAINTLTGSAAGTSKQLAVPNPAKKKSPSLEEVIKQFSGPIESVSGNQLTVSVKLLDFSKPKDPEKLKNANGSVSISNNDFEVIEKKITVNTNEKTVFANKKFADLKAGDVVLITSDKSPYTSNTVTAEKLTYIEPPK